MLLQESWLVLLPSPGAKWVETNYQILPSTILCSSQSTKVTCVNLSTSRIFTCLSGKYHYLQVISDKELGQDHRISTAKPAQPWSVCADRSHRSFLWYCIASSSRSRENRDNSHCLQRVCDITAWNRISNLQPTWAGSTPKLLGVSQYLFHVLI